MPKRASLKGDFKMNTIIQSGIHKQTILGPIFHVRVHLIKLSVFHFFTHTRYVCPSFILISK